MSRGDLGSFFDRPIAGTILVITAAIVVWAIAVKTRAALAGRGKPVSDNG